MTQEFIEIAYWLTGLEDDEDMVHIGLHMIESLDWVSSRNGVVVGEGRTTVLPPEDPRLPEVPDHISGPNVRALILEAPIIGEKEIPLTGGFTFDLDPVDLERMRRITREAWRAKFPDLPISDSQCDRIIDEMGPESAAKVVRRAVDSKEIH